MARCYEISEGVGFFLQTKIKTGGFYSGVLSYKQGRGSQKTRAKIDGVCNGQVPASCSWWTSITDLWPTSCLDGSRFDFKLGGFRGSFCNGRLIKYQKPFASPRKPWEEIHGLRQGFIFRCPLKTRGTTFVGSRVNLVHIIRFSF